MPQQKLYKNKYNIWSDNIYLKKVIIKFEILGTKNGIKFDPFLFMKSKI